MTTIAWDGVSLVGDRLRTFANVSTPARKVFMARRSDGSPLLYGCAGESDECVGFRRWLDGTGPERAFKGITAVAIDDKRRIWERAGDSGIWMRVPLKHYAIGSGGEFALGAMAAGATAMRAMEIACTFDKNSGLGYDVVRFP